MIDEIQNLNKNIYEENSSVKVNLLNSLGELIKKE
jgi:hypothetical protein